MKGKGKTPKNDDWKKKYNDPKAPDTTDLPELPEGWEWATIEHIALNEKSSITDGPFGSNLKSEHYTSDGPRVIRLENMGDGVFVDKSTHISEDHFNKLRKHEVITGDVVIAILGDPIPRAVLMPDIGPAIVKADCVRVRPDLGCCAPSYLRHALNSDVSRRQAKLKVHGVGRPRFNLGELKIISVPMPTLEEQAEIAQQLDDKNLEIDHLEVEMNLLMKQFASLRQSLLRSAFRGYLVPQDPSDEPASVLLERITAERAAADSGSKQRRKPRKKSKMKAAE